MMMRSEDCVFPKCLKDYLHIEKNRSGIAVPISYVFQGDLQKDRNSAEKEIFKYINLLEIEYKNLTWSALTREEKNGIIISLVLLLGTISEMITEYEIKPTVNQHYVPYKGYIQNFTKTHYRNSSKLMYIDATMIGHISSSELTLKSQYPDKLERYFYAFERAFGRTQSSKNIKANNLNDLSTTSNLVIERILLGAYLSLIDLRSPFREEKLSFKSNNFTENRSSILVNFLINFLDYDWYIYQSELPLFFGSSPFVRNRNNVINIPLSTYSILWCQPGSGKSIASGNYPDMYYDEYVSSCFSSWNPLGILDRHKKPIYAFYGDPEEKHLFCYLKPFIANPNQKCLTTERANLIHNIQWRPKPLAQFYFEQGVKMICFPDNIELFRFRAI